MRARAAVGPTTSHAALTWAISRSLATAVVSVRGSLDVGGAKRLRHALADLIEKQGVTAVRLDLRDMAISDAPALRTFRVAAAAARLQGAMLTFSSPSSAVYHHLVILGLADFVVASRVKRGLHPAGSALPRWRR